LQKLTKTITITRGAAKRSPKGGEKGEKNAEKSEKKDLKQMKIKFKRLFPSHRMSFKFHIVKLDDEGNTSRRTAIILGQRVNMKLDN